MADEQNNDILGSIDRMVDAERQLRARIADGSADSDAARQELTALEVRLDQCWDLLRRRRARTEFGEDPGTTRMRPADEVEGYES